MRDWKQLIVKNSQLIGIANVFAINWNYKFVRIPENKFFRIEMSLDSIMVEFKLTKCQ